VDGHGAVVEEGEELAHDVSGIPHHQVHGLAGTVNLICAKWCRDSQHNDSYHNDNQQKHSVKWYLE
jgi:hypothetical protein